MYKDFYGFREKPFSLNPDPAFLYDSQKHSMGLTMLEYGLASEASIVILTGEVGSGKTTLTRKLLQRVSSDMTVGLMTHTTRMNEDIFPWISLAFGLDYEGKETVSLFRNLNEFLQKEHKASRRVALIVDEAQNLSFEELDEMRMLSNVNVDNDLYMQLVLVGQPELLEKLRRPELRQLAQRISVDYNLAPLNREETALYIQHRIKVAGVEAKIFDESACALVYRESGGIPRLINIICDAALVFGFADGSRTIDAAIVKSVVQDRVMGGILPVHGSSRRTPHCPTPDTEAMLEPKSLDLSELPDRLTRAQAAEYLNRRHGIPVKEDTLYRRQLEDTGPPVVYFGRKPLYPIEGLNEWAKTALTNCPTSATKTVELDLHEPVSLKDLI